MELITSAANPRVKNAATLQRRRVRRERGQHLVEGPHAVEAALIAGVVTELFATETFALDDLGAAATTAEKHLTRVATHVLAKLVDTPAPQGVVAVANTPASTPLTAFTGGVVVVVDNNDPGNVGTIVRTADASGAAGVIVTANSADPYSPKALRSAAGSTYHLPLSVAVDPEELATHARQHGWQLAILDAHGTLDVQHFTPAAHVTGLCFGHETAGVDPVLAAHADLHITIPMFGRAESLNVAAAAAIATYAVCRQYHTSRLR